MDLKMQSYVDEHKNPIWDFVINEETGNFEVMPSELAEEEQRAIVAAFTQRGSIPQLPDVGVQWAELLTETANAPEINTQVVEAIQNNAGTFAYLPKYSKVGTKLVVSIQGVGR